MSKNFIENIWQMAYIIGGMNEVVLELFQFSSSALAVTAEPIMLILCRVLSTIDVAWPTLS